MLAKLILILYDIVYVTIMTYLYLVGQINLTALILLLVWVVLSTLLCVPLINYLGKLLGK